MSDYKLLRIRIELNFDALIAVVVICIAAVLISKIVVGG